MEAGEVIAPTNTESGYTVYTCANGCGKTEEKDFVMPLDSEVKNVQAIQVTDTMDLRVTWDAIKGASAYFVNVYDATGTKVRGTTITNGKNSARINGFEAGNYTVKVRAQVGEDFTAKYDAVAVTFTSLVPTAPIATIVETTKTSITVKWNAVEGAKIYYVRFVGADKTFLRVVNATEGETELQVTRTGLAVNTEYTVSICTEFADGSVTGYGEKTAAKTKDYADVDITVTKTVAGIAVAWNVSNDNGVSAVWVQRVGTNGKAVLVAAEYSATGEVIVEDIEGANTFYLIVEVMNDYGQYRYVRTERVTA